MADAKSKAQKLAEIMDDQSRVVVKVLEEQKEAKLEGYPFVKPNEVVESIKDGLAFSRDLYKSGQLKEDELEEFTRAYNTKAGFTFRAAVKAIQK